MFNTIPPGLLAAFLLAAGSASAQEQPPAEPPAASTAPVAAAEVLASTSSVEASTAAGGVALSTAPAEPPEPPRPWVVGEIEVSGARNIKPGVVRSQVKARKGDLYDRPDLDRDVQAVLSLGQFERVAADISPTDKPIPAHLKKAAGFPFLIKLTFMVSEKPVVKKVSFEGNKKVGKGTLLDLMTLKAKDPFDPFKLRDDEQKMVEKYHEKGFLDASLASSVAIDTAALQAFVVFKIQEGPRSRIEKVAIDGVKAFRPRKLLKLMRNKRKKSYAERELGSDLKKVEAHYLNRGYLDVEVGTATVTVSPDKTKIYIRFPVKEGAAYKFGDSTFSGYTLYDVAALAKTLEYRKGKTFSQEKYEESVRGIQELYAEKGRLKARVTPTKTFNEKTKLMDVHYHVAEGSIVYIDHVDIEGNKATKGYVLRREVLSKPGDIFSASKVRRSRERILNLGFIDEVDIDIQGTQDPDKVDIIFDIAEGKPGLLTAGMAYSSVDGFIGTLSMSHLNLFGRAQRAKVEWQFGRRVQDYYVSWLTPWVYDRPMSLGFDVFNTRRLRPFGSSSSAYVERQRGGTVRVGPRFQQDIYNLNIAYTFSRIEISNVDFDFRGPIQEGSRVYSAVDTSFARDTRDNIWDPTRGSRHSVGVLMAGGAFRGDTHLLSPSMSNFSHHHLFSAGDYPFVLTFANRFGYVTQFSGTKIVPVNHRFFVGGQDTLRGYASTGEVGFPSGGKAMDVFNVEFGFPLARERRRTIVKFVLFFDAGGAWDRMRDMHLRVGSGERDIKTDAGFGIRFTTPAFPIRLDYGYGFNHRPGERLYQINFGLGNLF